MEEIEVHKEETTWHIVEVERDVVSMVVVMEGI